MKKLIILLLLFSGFSAFAQERGLKRTYLGINSGFSLSRIIIDPSFDYMFNFSTDQGFRSGFDGGIVFLHYSQPRVGIQMELNYSQRGWTENLDTISYNRRLDYVEFPFLTHFDIGKKKLKIAISFGPVISYFISEKKQVNYLDENQVKEYYSFELDHKLEGALCIGLGVNKYTRIGNFQAEVRIKQGLTSIFKKDRVPEFSSSQNQAIELKISYLIGWGRL